MAAGRLNACRSRTLEGDRLGSEDGRFVGTLSLGCRPQARTRRSFTGRPGRASSKNEASFRVPLYTNMQTG